MTARSISEGSVKPLVDFDMEADFCNIR